MKNQLTVFPAIFTFDGKYYNVDFIDLKDVQLLETVYKTLMLWLRMLWAYIWIIW